MITLATLPVLNGIHGLLYAGTLLFIFAVLLVAVCAFIDVVLRYFEREDDNADLIERERYEWFLKSSRR